MVEQWRPVPSHPDRYEVSDRGRVRCMARVARRGFIALFEFDRKILKQAVGGRARNYRRVMLANPKRHAYVHHLVAEAFLGPRPEGAMVLHMNDNGFDNRLANLRYGDREENELDRHVARVAPALEASPF